MASNRKRYQSADAYEKKLERVMERLGVTNYNYNWDRWEGWVEFHYRGELYRFNHSTKKAQERGVDIKFGSDAFAQIVLSLEDLARMVERGIYELSTWVAGMKYLPEAVETPTFFRTLGFTEIPSTPEDVTLRYRDLVKLTHPDVGGEREDFEAIQRAAEKARDWFNSTKPEV